WEGIPTPYTKKVYPQISRHIRIFRSDSTILDVETFVNGKDEMVSGHLFGSGWGEWQRLPGDSIITISGVPGWRIVLQNGQLSLSSYIEKNGKEELLEVYKPIELKQP